MFFFFGFKALVSYCWLACRPDFPLLPTSWLFGYLHGDFLAPTSPCNLAWAAAVRPRLLSFSYIDKYQGGQVDRF